MHIAYRTFKRNEAPDEVVEVALHTHQGSKFVLGEATWHEETEVFASTLGDWRTLPDAVMGIAARHTGNRLLAQLDVVPAALTEKGIDEMKAAAHRASGGSYAKMKR